MKSILKNWLMVVLVLVSAPCMSQSYEPAFDPTSAFVNGEQDLSTLLYGSFDGNVASIYQQQSSDYGSPDNGDSNIALIDQVDSEATIAQIWQVGMGNYATVTQTGVNNIVRFGQVGIDHIASISQEGDTNTIIGLMQGEKAKLTASQIGESNYMNVVLNSYSELNIKQEGIGNTFSVVLAPNAYVGIVQYKP